MSRMLTFFATLGELSAALRPAIDNMDLTVVLSSGTRLRSLEIASDPAAWVFKDGDTPAIVWFTRMMPSEIPSMAADRQKPDQWGWVMLRLPQSNGSVLRFGWLGCRTLPAREEPAFTLDRPHSDELHDLLARPLRKITKAGMRCWSPTAERWVVDRRLRYSAGALDWVGQGGSLASGTDLTSDCEPLPTGFSV
jgi:hypothetical protein